MLSARCNVGFYRKYDNMKKILCVMMLAFMVCPSAWAEVNINAENFPDSVFRAYVRASFDTDSNGY